ncbi:MAG: GNAT family N-acetyltransferase [Rhodospirillales bacterium]|nr:GNAT family N-acetyltransferase [Rhodospirillales bacterium]
MTIRRAAPADAAAIGAVHVAAWRSAYPGILPPGYLARLSAFRQARHYELAIRTGAIVHVAVVEEQVVGFATAGAARGTRLADGEIETLYVLDDWRDRGLGRALMTASAAALAEAGCRDVFVWVLRDNPSRWFYARLGGRKAAEGVVRVAGVEVAQTAFVWSPISLLVTPAAGA